MFNTLQSPHELLALLRVALEQNLSLLHNDKDFDKIASVVDLKLYRLWKKERKWLWGCHMLCGCCSCWGRCFWHGRCRRIIMMACGNGMPGVIARRWSNGRKPQEKETRAPWWPWAACIWRDWVRPRTTSKRTSGLNWVHPLWKRINPGIARIVWKPFRLKSLLKLPNFQAWPLFDTHF